MMRKGVVLGSSSLRNIRHKQRWIGRNPICVSLLAIRDQSTSKPENSILDSASDYFGALRWRAANALTSSLSPDERGRLLETMDSGRSPQEEINGSNSVKEDEKVDSDNHVQEISIAEAVAAARAQEAKLHSDKWEKEKAQLMEEAEQAALERVESDLAIQRRRLAFEAWKKDLEKENSAQTAEAIQDSTTQAETTADTASQEHHHPILGPVLADLGNKRIHLVSAKALSAIPVWKKQRIYRHGRATAMANDKLKSLHLGLPGIIGVYEVCYFNRFRRLVSLGAYPTFIDANFYQMFKLILSHFRVMMAACPFLMDSIGWE